MVSQTLLLAHITCLPGIQNPLFSSTLGESVRSSLNGGGGRRNPSTFAYLLHLVTLVYSAGRIITFVSIHQLWEPGGFAFFCLGIHGTWFNQLGIHPLLIATYCTPGSSTSIYTARSNHNIRQTLRRSTFAPHICYDMAFALFSGQEMLLGYTWHSCTWQQRVFHKNVPSHASW